MNISTEDLIERGFAPQSGVVDILLIFPPTSVSRRYGKANLGDLGGDLIPLGIAFGPMPEHIRVKTGRTP